MVGPPSLSLYLRALAVACAPLWLSGCGGSGYGGGGGGGGSTTYTIGVSVSGLTGTVVLQNNGGDNLSLSANGSATFTTAVASGAAYSVSVMTQPSGQNCLVVAGSGNAMSNISGIRVVCGTNSRYALVANSLSANLSVYAIDQLTGALAEVAGSPFSSGPTPVMVVTDPSAKFAYVSNVGDNTISGFSIDGTGVLVPLAGSPFGVPGQSGPGVIGAVALTVHPGSGSLYAPSITNANVTRWAIDPVSGVLSADIPLATGTIPQVGALDPQGKVLIIPNQSSNDVSAYVVDAASGVLTAAAGSPFPAGQSPLAAAIEPSGKFAYVVASNSANPASISAYAINAATGVLQAVPGSPFATGLGADSITFDASGKFLYVPNPAADNIYAYSIDSSTGALAMVAGSPFATAAGAGPRYATIDRTGQYLYCPRSAGTGIDAFRINPTTGVLTPLAGSPFASAGSASYFSIDGGDRFGYAVNSTSNNISAFSIDAATGALTAVPGSPYAAGSNPVAATLIP